MKLEEALKLMREGKKIRHPFFDKDVHFEGCYISLKYTDETFEDAKLKGMSIVKMKGDRQHPDMQPSFDKCMNPCEHGSTPQISIFLLMADDWEIVE